MTRTKDRNEGFGGSLLQQDSCSPAATVSVYCCQAGQGKLCGWARMEGRQRCRMPQPWLLCLHISCSRHRSCRLLAIQVLLASLAFPTPSFLLFYQTSLVFPSKRRDLASAPCLWRHLLANLQVPAVLHLQTSFSPHSGTTW